MNSIYVFIIVFALTIIISLGLIERFSEIPPRRLFFGIFYVSVGLMVGSLLSIPLSNLPGLWGEWSPIAITVIVVSILSTVFWRNHQVTDKWVTDAVKSFNVFRSLNLGSHTIYDAVVDTSVLIDARIVDIVKTGFMPFKIIIPRFVLNELQNIADSTDSERRSKGRRGLDSVEKIRKEKDIKIEISNEDFPNIQEVDRKLIALSKKGNAALITTDYNLNKLAKAEGVKVLNINELSQSLRPDLLPGQEMAIKVVHLGKEKNQGVGYMPDGTMIVVEKGDKLLEKTVNVKITRALQTAAGKMFFAKVINGDKNIK